MIVSVLELKGLHPSARLYNLQLLLVFDVNNKNSIDVLVYRLCCKFPAVSVLDLIVSQSLPGVLLSSVPFRCKS